MYSKSNFNAYRNTNIHYLHERVIVMIMQTILQVKQYHDIIIIMNILEYF